MNVCKWMVEEEERRKKKIKKKKMKRATQRNKVPLKLK